MRWEDIDGDLVRLPGPNAKNREARSIVAAGELRDVLARRREARSIKTADGAVIVPWVFHRHGAPVKEFYKSWKTACKKAGIPSRLFHDLRRTAIRNMVRAGCPERVAMSISGHKTRSVFDRYNIVNEQDLREAMQRVNEYHEATRQKIVSIV